MKFLPLIIIPALVLQLQSQLPLAAPTPASTGSSQQAHTPIPTTLPLSLLGTVVNSNQENLAVILDTSSNKQRLLNSGDVVLDATIERIERGRVILLVNGQQQVLRQKNRQGGGAGAVTGSLDMRILPPDIMPPPPPPVPAPVPKAKKL